KDEEGIWHEIKSKGNIEFEEGKEVLLKLDWKRRYSFMKAHSSQHLISHILEEIYQCRTLKANFEEGKIDIETSKKLSLEQVLKALEQANDIINSGTKIKSIVVDQEEYKKKFKQRTRGKTSDEKTVRLIQLGENDGFDLACCGGIHVKNLSEVKGIVLENLKGYTLKLLVDQYGFSFANQQRKIMIVLEELTQKKDEKLIEMIQNKLNSFDVLQSGNVKLLKMIFSNLQHWKITINGLSCVFFELPEIDRQAIQSAAKEMIEGFLVVIIGKNEILYILSSDESIPANEVTKKLLEITKNKGGGNKAFAQISIQKVENPLKLVKDVIKNFQT
ncbi:MAG: hypothetical protein KAU62_17685, partial [Candidatus Heimdallarchaeota archaeon]|nr:hypothetical protein [Candidatus Heimdallarchaeota archaeon]MCK4612993.1 hypothetical protein [Candidatus Heimdallarchaeota archaeon]